MSGIRFTRDAEADILDIHEYTFEMFGERQCHLYEASLRVALDTILSNPRIGADRAFVRPSTRRLLFESHAIYYEIDGSDVLILRILSVRQDPGRHL